MGENSQRRQEEVAGAILAQYREYGNEHEEIQWRVEVQAWY